jgi:putative NADH-flavin reductase
MTRVSLAGALLAGLVIAVFSTAAHAKKIVIFGASGSVGEAIVQEALSRGHEVTGISRTPEKFTYKQANFKGVQGDPTDVNSVLRVTQSAEAIINAIDGRSAAMPEETAMNQSAIALSKVFADLGAKGPQIVAVGGAMTMNGTKEKMREKMPANVAEGSAMFALFMGHMAAYETYQKSTINWTFVAPPMNIKGFRGGDNIRTGKYRTSTTDFVVDATGNSSLSMADLAIAIVDFAEKGNFNKVKVAVGE